MRAVFFPFSFTYQFSRFLETKIIFLLQDGTHFIFPSDFSVLKPELFRRAVVEILIQPLSLGLGFVNIVLKTNLFYIFVSKSLTITSINFIGGDISMKSSECSLQSREICCNSTLILDPSNSCYFDETQVVLTIPEYKGLFNLEYLFDRTEYPIIKIKNSILTDFLLIASYGGFSSIFSMAPFSGTLDIHDSYILNSFFHHGFVQFSNLLDDFYSNNRINVMWLSEFGSNINNLEENFAFKNLKFINYNVYFKQEKNRAFLFYFIECNANISFDSLQFNNIINSVIVKFVKGSNKAQFYFNDLKFEKLVDVSVLQMDDYANEISLSSVLMNNITNYVSLFSLNNVVSAKIENLQMFNLNIYTGLGAIEILNTNVNLSHSTFENCSVISIIVQTGMTLSASFLSFTNILFSRSLIYLIQAYLIDLHTSYFAGLKTNLSLFYISYSEILNFTSILIESSSLFSIFYVDKAKMLSIYDLIAKNNSISMIWKEDQNCDLTLFTKSQLTNNIFSARLYYLKKAAPTTRIMLDQVMISFNNLTSISMITILVGFINIQKIWVINNFFLNPLYSYMISFQERVVADLQNSYFEDSGVLFKKTIYLGLADDVFVYVWFLTYGFLKNNIFVVTKLIQLASGFISGSPGGTHVEIIGNHFLTISTNPNFYYKAIFIDSLQFLRLEDNIFFNSRCNSRTFSHSHGTVSIFGSSSYGYSKNNYIAYIANNTFYNGSCSYGGNIAVMSYSKVEMKNCYFKNSSSNHFGGSMAIFSIPNLIISNISTIGSVANEGGAFYFQNIFYSVFTNFSIVDVLSGKTGAISIKYAQSLLFDIYEGRNITSFGDGGFMFVFRSNINITNGKIRFSRAKEGGAFYLNGNASLYFENNSISEMSADEAGAISAFDVHEISIKNLKMDHLVGTLRGAAIVFGVVKKVKILNFIIESAFSKGEGVILCKVTDDNGIIEINNMLCKWTQALTGSCFYHLSAIPVDITNLKIEGNGACPLFFRWSFAIQINLRKVEVVECNINSNLVSISGVNLNLVDLFLSSNNVEGFLVYIQFCIFVVIDSRFINNNFSAMYFEDSDFKIENLEVSNPYADSKLSFLVSTNSKGEIKNLTLTEIESNNNILIKFEKGNLVLVDITCLNSLGRFLTLTKTNLNFSNSHLSNISTSDKTANEIFYANDDNRDYYVNIDKLNVISFQSISFFCAGRLVFFIKNSWFEYQTDTNDKLAMTTAVSVSNLIELTIYNSIFINFTQNAIFLKTERHLNSTFNILSSIFLRNKGSIGGALFIQGNVQLLIDHNIFEGNQALNYKLPLIDLEGVGGCIFYQAFSDNFGFKLFSNNFSDNYASNSISLIFSQSKISLDNLNNFSQNEDIISFPLKTRLVSNLSASIISIVSGKPFDLIIELVDIFDRRVNFDNSTILNSKIAKKKVGNTLVIQNPIGYSREGLITFKNLQINTNPNSNFSLIVSGFFLGLRSEFISEELIESEYNFYARECLRGEIILADFSCFKCIKGSYSLIDPMVLEVKYQRCNSCPNNADCFGGNIIAPYPGFYRKSNMSRNVMACINAGACLGSINEINVEEINGECKEGNSETLCYYCEFGYGRFDLQGFCQKCASISTQVYARLIVYVLFLIAYILLNCNFAENFNTMHNNDKPNISTFTKFFLNHSQQASVIFLSSVSPVGALATSLLQALDYLSFSNGTAISNDCLLQNIFFEKESFVIWKEILTLVLPIIFCFLSLSLWSICCYVLSFTKYFYHLAKKLPKTPQEITKKVALFLIISTIIFYPLILKSCFNLFNCIRIDLDENVMFLKNSPNLQCWALTHMYYIAFIGLPGILVWGIFFPVFLIVFLKKNLISQRTTSNQEELERKQITVRGNLEPPKKKENYQISYLKTDNENIMLQTSKKKKFTNVVTLKNNKFQQKLSSKSSFGVGHNVSNLLENPNSNQAFMFFCRDYKNKFYYWESLIFFRKFIITFIFTLDESIPIESKTVITWIFLCIYIKNTGKQMPYKEGLCNNLEIMSLSVLGITIFSNLLFNSEAYTTLKIIFFAITLLANLIFYIIICFKLAKIFIKEIKKKKLEGIKVGSRSQKIEPSFKY